MRRINTKIHIILIVAVASIYDIDDLAFLGLEGATPGETIRYLLCRVRQSGVLFFPITAPLSYNAVVERNVFVDYATPLKALFDGVSSLYAEGSVSIF